MSIDSNMLFLWIINIFCFTTILAGPLAKLEELVEQRDEGDTTLGRLPTALRPINYNLQLQPDIYTGSPPFYFNGTVDIRFEVFEFTNIIYLNSVDLTIFDNVDVVIAPDTPEAGPDPVLIRWELDETLQFLKIFLDDYMMIGAHYIVQLEFNGTMRESWRGDGLYWESYESILDGQTKYLAVTLFWAAAARYTFPCFDEPQMKATFDITLLRKDNVVALATMNSIAEEDRGNGWIAETFNTTVPMSTYLVCFVIGDFDYLESFTSRGTPVRVWARPDYAEDLVWANTLAASLQESHESWTGLIDPLPKMDHIAVPGFAGAMENWGLVVYSERTLLYNETYSNLADQRRVAAVISHELAHMWFGNLVTCRWWNDAWLNEGFATFFEHLPQEDVLGWDADEYQMFGSIRRILDLDSSATSAPVRVEIDSPWQGVQAYSTYAYNKGGALLRMLKQMLGESTFQRGLQRYLNRFAYSNAETDDLWQALTDQAEIDNVTDTDGFKLFIKEKMDPWVDQRGYPLVRVTRTTPNSVEVTQTQFLKSEGQTPPPSPFLYEWYVPLTFTNEESLDWNEQTDAWLNRDNKTINNGLPSSMDQWFVVNINQNGFYRVKYDNVTYNQITQQLEVDALVMPSLTRHAILNEAVEFVRAGLEPEVYAMEATKFLNQEDTYLVWSMVASIFNYQHLVLARYQPAFDFLQEYLRSKLDPTYMRFGWVNIPADDNLRRSARAEVIWLTCYYGNSDCEIEARRQFDTYKDTPNDNSIYIDHRLSVYCSSIRSGSTDDWDFLHSQYLAIADSNHRGAPPEIDRILLSLACASDSTLIQRYINFTFDDANIRSGDASFVIDSLANSDTGRWILWNHLKTTWDNDPLPIGVNKISTLLSIVEGFANEDDVAELEEFIALYPPMNEGESSAYDQARNTVNTNKAWADENVIALSDWYQANTG